MKSGKVSMNINTRLANNILRVLDLILIPDT